MGCRYFGSIPFISYGFLIDCGRFDIPCHIVLYTHYTCVCRRTMLTVTTDRQQQERKKTFSSPFEFEVNECGG